MHQHRLSTRWRWMFVAIGLVLMVGSGTIQAAERAPVPPKGLLPPAQPTFLPDFRLPSVDGKTLGAADLRGKVVVMRFWATWLYDTDPARCQDGGGEGLRGFAAFRRHSLLTETGPSWPKGMAHSM